MTAKGFRYVPVFGQDDDLMLVDFDDGQLFSDSWQAAETINWCVQAAHRAEEAAERAERTATRERLKADL
ncbi:MAG: hypothetical protein WBA46_01455, partial [Thermomicrobiales bacterium]